MSEAHSIVDGFYMVRLKETVYDVNGCTVEADSILRIAREFEVSGGEKRLALIDAEGRLVLPHVPWEMVEIV